MKSFQLENDFNAMLEKTPYSSDFTCFNIVIEGKKYSHYLIRKMFNRLVDKYEYGKEDKEEIIKYCQELTKLDKKINNYD